MEEEIRQFSLLNILSQGIERVEFCDYVRSHGFAVVKLSEEYCNLFTETYLKMESWYSQSKFTKDMSVPYDPVHEVGYFHNQQLSKEFFAVKKSNVDKGVHFEQQSLKIYEIMEHLAKTILDCLAVGLKVESSKLLDLCDLENYNKHPFSTSLFHFFHYYSKQENFKSCTEHTDSGLVTIIPCATTPGLECLDWSTFKWVETEKLGEPGTYLTVLCGETMARLTCNYYQGTVHRVVQQSGERYSIPFQLRARPDATIDSVGLESPVISVPLGLRDPIKVSDFIQ